jgi:SPOR domain
VLTRRSLAALALFASACGPSSQSTELRNAIAATGTRSDAGQAVAVRFAGRSGADVRLYGLPGLTEVAWRFQTPGLVAERVVGYSADHDAIYALSPSGQLMALDLTTGRARPADTLVVSAAMGPDGAVLLAHRDGDLARLSSRRVTPVARGEDRAAADRDIEAIHGSAGGRMVAVVRDGGVRAIAVSSAGKLGPSRPIPDGPLALTPWGDAAAIATDSGIVMVDLLRGGADRYFRMRQRATVVGFSSSGHRLFVLGDQPPLSVLDRFELRRMGAIALPTTVTELRPDAFGAWLLGRADDSVVIIPQSGGMARVTAGGWAPDLPAAAPDGTILVRRGRDVVSLDPQTLQPSGHVRDGAADRWLVVRWDPRRPALQAAAASQPGEPGAPAPTGQEIFVQVSSTTNQQWADDLARDLRLAGMRALVLAPVADEEMFRVVVGPYGSRDEAEEAGRELGMPYWIFTRSRLAP